MMILGASCLLVIHDELSVLSSGGLRGGTASNEGKGFTFLWNEVNLQVIVKGEYKLWVANYEPVRTKMNNESKWQHIVMSWSQANGLKAYQNGRLVAQDSGITMTVQIPAIYDSQSFVNIGGMYSYSHNSVQYNIYDIKFWRYDLGIKDVLDLYEPDHNISYVIHDFPLSNWSEARAICQKLDGDLASINNDEEDKLLSSMPNFSPSIDYWIGFNDIQQEGNFSWSDGSKFSYKKWASRQPDNANNEDCGTYKGNWGWNDLACHNKRRFICKMDSSKDMPLTITKEHSIDLLLHSEGCNDPTKKTGTCGWARIELNGYDVSLHGRGLNVAIIDYITGLLKSVKTFDIHFKAEYGEMLTAYINAAPKNVIIAIAGQDEPSRYFATVKDALQSVGGTRSTLEDRSSYVLLGFKGNLSVNWTVDAYSGSGKGPTTLRRTIKLPPADNICKFPFFYNGVAYSSCESVESCSGRVWCSTEAGKKYSFITEPKAHVDFSIPNYELLGDWKIGSGCTETKDTGPCSDLSFAMKPGEEIPLFYSERILEDAVWKAADSSCHHAGPHVYFPYDGSSRDVSALIKVDLTDIPATATISKANLRFQADMDSPVNSTLEAELFVLSAEENNVYLTGCYHQTMEAQSHYGPVDWVMEQWKVSKIYYTPDFSNLLSPIIKSKRWRTYAYVVIKAKSGYSGPKTYRRAYSVNAGNQHQKPRIEMEYFDKTPANYIYADATAAVETGDLLSFTTRYFPPIYKCIRFWYFMYGDGVGTLRGNLFQRYVIYKEVFRMHGDRGQKWMKATIPLNGMREDGALFKMIFISVRNDNTTGDIAIDDIGFSVKSCSFQPLSAKPPFLGEEMLILDKFVYLKLPQPVLLIPFDNNLNELIFRKAHVHRISKMNNGHVLDIYGHPVNYGYIKYNATTCINVSGSGGLFSIYGGFTVSLHIRPDDLREATILSFVNSSSQQQMAISSSANGAVTVSVKIRQGKEFILTTGNTLEAQKWNILTVVFNVEETVMQVFNNHKKVAERVTGNDVPSIRAVKGVIGTSFQEYTDTTGQTTNIYKGYVACLQVYDKCLRSHEIKVLIMCPNQHSAVRCKDACKGDGVCDQITGMCLCPPDTSRHVNSDCSNDSITFFACMAYTEVTLPLVHVVDVIFDHAHHDGSSLIRQPKARQAFKEFYRQVQRQCYQKTPQLCLEIALEKTIYKNAEVYISFHSHKELKTNVEAENVTKSLNGTDSYTNTSQSCKHSFAYLTQGSTNLGVCMKIKSAVNLYDSRNKLRSNDLIFTNNFTISVWIYIPPVTEWNNKTSIAIIRMGTLKISAQFGELSETDNPLHYIVYGTILLEIAKVNVSQKCYWHVKAVSGAWTHLSIISYSDFYDIYYNGKAASITNKSCNASQANTVVANFTDNRITVGGDISGICIDELAIWTSQSSSSDIAWIYSTISNGSSEGLNKFVKVQIQIRLRMERFKWVNELRDMENLDRLRVVKNINDTISSLFAANSSYVTSEYEDIKEGTKADAYQEVIVKVWLGFSYLGKAEIDILNGNNFKDSQITCGQSHCFFSLTGKVIGVPYSPPELTVLKSMSRNITLKYEIPKENIGAPHYGFIYKFNAISKLPNNPRIHDREETTTNAGIIWQLQDLMPYMSYTLTVYAASHQGLSFPKTQTIETAPEVPELEPKDLKCDALNQTHIEVNFTQIEYIRWNGVPIGYKVFWGSMLQLEDKEIFQVVNFNSTSLNVHNVEEPSFQYTITIMDLEIFTNYSIIVGAYNGEGIGKLARVYCRTQEGVPEQSPTNLSAVAVNSTHFNISFTPLPEDVEIWNSFVLEYYHIKVIEVFIPRFINKTMDLIVSKDTHQVIFGPVEQDREYSMVMAGVTKSGWGKKSKRICVRTYQASPSAAPIQLKVFNESSTELKLLVGNVTHEHENGKILYYNVSLAKVDSSPSGNKTEINQSPTGNKTETNSSTSGNKTEEDSYLTANETFIDKATKLFHYKVDVMLPSPSICQPDQLLSNQTASNDTVPSNQTSTNDTVRSNQTTSSCTHVSLPKWIIPEINHSYSTHKCKWNLALSQTSAIMEYLIGNLMYYTFYTLTASACTSVGCGPSTSPFVVRTDEHTPTCSPINVTVRNMSSTSMRIQWDRTPEHCTHGIITVYTLYFGEERTLKIFNTTYWHPDMILLRNISNVRTVPFPSQVSVFSDLKKFVSHCVLVQAHTSKGPGPLTPSYCAHTAEDAPEGPPRNVSCYSDSSTSLRCIITPPSRQTVNGIIRGYIVYLYETNTNCSKLDKEFNVTFRRDVTSNIKITDDVTTDRVSQLKKFTFYAIEAVAYTSIGLAERKSQCNIFRTLEDVPSRGPRDVSIFNVSSTNFTICWRLIHKDFIHGIMRKFKLIVSETLNDDTQGIYQITYLPISTAGKYINLSPLSGNSSVVNSSVANSSIVKNHSNTNGSSWLFFHCHSFSSLRPFTRYHLRVAGCTTPGCGPISESNTRTQEEAPSAPVLMLVGHNTSSTSILIEWKSPPVLQQNGILIGYYIQWKEFCTNTLINELPSRIDVIYIPNCNLTTSSITNSTNTKDTSFQINGLHPFTNYEITVLANTSVGGGPSVTVTVISDQDVPDEPPNNVTGFHTNGHSMQIHWNQIQFQFRNSYVLKYYIFYQKVNSTEPEKFFVCSKTSYLPSSCEMTELEYQTAYFVSVAGVSSEGIGRKSKAIIVSTGPYVHGNWSEWSTWSSCSESCGGGQKDRSRTCTDPRPWNGGLDCVGDRKETKICNTNKCSGYYHGENAEDCDEACVRHDLNCNPQIITAATLDDFNRFLEQRCKREENSANHTKEYHPIYKNSTGVCEGYRFMPEWIKCDVKPPADGNTQRLCSCLDKGDIGFSLWTEWSLCSVDCGGGKQRRIRECESPFGCKGEADQILDCNRQPCPVDGQWGSWSEWSGCNQTCGYGYQHRKRYCNNPPPTHGGENCSGTPVDIRGECNPLPCPRNGEWSTWGEWKSCNQACGTGVQHRKRYCNNPSPLYGGESCAGNDTDNMACTLEPCEGQKCHFVCGLPDYEWDICYHYPESPCYTELSNLCVESINAVHSGTVGIEAVKVNEISPYNPKYADEMNPHNPKYADEMKHGSVIVNFSIFYSAVKNTEVLFLQDIVEITGKINNLTVKPITVQIPSVLVSPPTNLKPTIINATSINITWTPPKNVTAAPNISKYFIFYRPIDSQVGLWEADGSKIGSNSHLLTDLMPATKYRIRMTISITTGNGPASEEVIAETSDGVPDAAPSNLKVMSIKASEVFLEWTPIPRANVHGILKGYEIKYKKYFDKEYAIEYTESEISEKTISRLKGFSLYLFEVSAYTTTGKGPPVAGVIKTLEGVPEVAPIVSIKDLAAIDFVLVEWQKIPDEKLNGRLLGYRIRYTTFQIGTAYVIGDSDTKVTDVDKFTFSLKITGLQSFTKYTITVSGVNIPGEGPQSDILQASTCKCPEYILNNWYENRPYVIKSDKRDVSGPFPTIIRNAIEMSCGVCNDNKKREIYFFKSRDGENTEKRSEIKLIDSISSKFHINFPVFGQVETTAYMERFIFISVVKSSGSAMIIRDEHVMSAKTTAVFKSVMGVWPVLVLSFFITVMIGILIWFTEQFENADEFTTGNYMVGVCQGIWWAFVSMTTVGYGDIAPRTCPGRIVSIAWTLTGLVLTGIITGAITSSLTILTVPPEVKLYGTKVAAINNSFEHRLGVMRNSKVNLEKSYETVDEVLSALETKKVDAALLDSFVAASHQNALDARHLKIKKFIDGNSAYGLVLSGEFVRLDNDFRSQIAANQDFISQFVANMTSKLQITPDEHEEPRLFDPNGSEFWAMLRNQLILLGIFTFIGLVWWLKFRYAKKRMSVRPDRVMLEALLDNMRPVVDEFTTKIKDKLVKTSRSHIDQIMELFSVKSKYKRYTKRFSIKQEQFYELTSVPGKNKDFRKNLKYQKYMVDA